MKSLKQPGEGQAELAYAKHSNFQVSELNQPELQYISNLSTINHRTKAGTQTHSAHRSRLLYSSLNLFSSVIPFTHQIMRWAHGNLCTLHSCPPARLYCLHLSLWNSIIPPQSVWWDFHVQVKIVFSLLSTLTHWLLFHTDGNFSGPLSARLNQSQTSIIVSFHHRHLIGHTSSSKCSPGLAKADGMIFLWDAIFKYNYHGCENRRLGQDENMEIWFDL